MRQHFQCDGTALLMVGDRYLTDVVFGNLHGMLTVHTEQLTTAGDNRVAQTMRRVEDWLVARYDRRMLELLRLECVSLHRTRIGALRLGGLPCGQWRFVERLDVLGAVGR